jgi:iron(III) transport system ATP-binding protein
MANGIEFQQVTKRYGDAKSPLVIKGVDLVVPKGTLSTILGPSGCGKTTLLRMIAGLDAPTAGRILIDGQDVTTLGPAERNVSMVFQSYALFPHMNVLANVGYGLVVQGMAQRQAEQRARAAMDSVGLAGYDTRLPSELSGGQQQRVAVARSLVLEPSEIRALQQRLQLTVAYVTHDQSEALAVSDQIIVMDAGRIAQAGTPQQLYEHPASEFVAGFMGEAMLFDGQALTDGTVRLGPLTVLPRQPVAPGAVKVAVRPEAWRLSHAEAAPGLRGTVQKCAYLGSCQEVTLDTALGSIFVVSPELERPWQPGQTAWLSLAGHGLSVVRA